MSLRLRLVLTLLSVVAMIAVADLVALRINRGIQSRMKALRTRSRGLAEATDFDNRAVEIEGRWDESSGAFLALSVEWLPGPRSPKLRGVIQSIDSAVPAITIYGQSVRITDRTEFQNNRKASGSQVGRHASASPPGNDARPRSDLLSALAPGARVEVVAKVDPQGAWTARKINTRPVKASDKIKGTVSRAKAMDNGSRVLDIQGLRIRVDRTTAMPNPHSPLNQMESATRMTLAVQDGRTAAQTLLKDGYRLRSARQKRRAGADPISSLEERIEDSEKSLRRAQADFASYLGESRTAAEKAVRPGGRPHDADSLAAEHQKIALWLDPLARLLPRWKEVDTRFSQIVGKDPDAAEALLRGDLEPLLRDDVLPLVHAYQLETERELSNQLGAVADDAEAAARLTIITKVAGIVVALLLGLFVSRTISGPIRTLKAAARRIGRGNLDTRVAIRSHDELGILASAFNRMAEELAETTVSVSHLNSVIDSMTGALLLLNPQGAITNVNPAALMLLGCTREDLMGQPFSKVCPEEAGEGSLLRARPQEPEVVPTVERTFLKKDGTALPVSCSGAAMHDDEGELLGFVFVAQDLTDRKRIEEQIRRSLAEKELLLREVHHRVKNNLQVISSILDLQSRSISDPKALEKFQESQDRIRSMSLLHEQLYGAGDLHRIDFPTYVEHLASHLSQSHRDGPHAPHLQVHAEPMSLDLDQALACGLIVNELVTNAYKHAFGGGGGGSRGEAGGGKDVAESDAGGSRGEIRVDSRRVEDDMCVLSVTDDGRGVGGDFDPQSADTLGMSLVSTLVDQLHGKLSVEGEGGTRFRIEFPPRGTKEPA